MYNVGMGIFSSFNKKNKFEKVLLVSIGSSSVSAAFVEIGEKISTVTATINTDISVITDLSLIKFEQEMEKALKQSLVAISRLHLGAPDRIAVFFFSPWYASQVRIAKMSRPTPFVVSKTLLNDMIAHELKAFEDEELNDKRVGTESLRAIESKVVQIKLNGYPTTEPIDLSASELEISIFLSIAPERTITRIEEIISQTYHQKVTFSSFAGASFLVVRDFFPHQEDYLLIDVGGEVTDVMLVRESAIVQSSSFPLGRNFMLRKLSLGLKRSVAESVTICSLYVEDKVEASVKETCTKILTEAKDAWLEQFQRTLFSISNELSIPDTVLLSVNTEVAPWFIETIRREKFNQYALTEKEFNVIVLNAEVFHESLAFVEGVPRDSCIIMEALACTIIQKQESYLIPQKSN